MGARLKLVECRGSSHEECNDTNAGSIIKGSQDWIKKIADGGTESTPASPAIYQNQQTTNTRELAISTYRFLEVF